MTTRKLIRPNLTEIKERLPQGRNNGKRRAAPPDQTSAEAFYYLHTLGQGEATLRQINPVVPATARLNSF